MNRSEVFKNLIVDFIIFLFVLKLRSSNLYRKILKRFSWNNFFKVEFKAQIKNLCSEVRVKIATQEVMECCF